MRGTIRARGKGRWQVQIYLGAVGGKDRRRARTITGTKRQAEALLTRMLAEADRTRTVAGGDEMTVTELLDRWHELRSPSWSPRTALVTRGIIDRHITPRIGTMPLWKVGPAELDDLYGQLLTGAGLAPRSVIRVHGALHAAFQQARRWRYISQNPASDATPPSAPRKQSRAYDPEKLRALLTGLEEDQLELAVFVRVAAITGCRRGEVAALRWPAVDLAGATIRVEASLTEGEDGWVEKSTKTDRERPVAIDARTVALLERWRAELEGRLLSLGLAADPAGWVFPAALDPDRPTTPDVWTRRWVVARKRHGLDGVRLQDLRHGVPTLLLPRGHDVNAIAGRLGHADASTTLDVYSHVLPAADRVLAEDMAKVIDGV